MRPPVHLHRARWFLRWALWAPVVLLLVLVHTGNRLACAQGLAEEREGVTALVFRSADAPLLFVRVFIGPSMLPGPGYAWSPPPTPQPYLTDEAWTEGMARVRAAQEWERAELEAQTIKLMEESTND